MEKSSKKCVVLFTRYSESYEDAFVQEGYDVIFASPLQFDYTNVGSIVSTLCRENIKGLILTSPRAAKALDSALSKASEASLKAIRTKWMNQKEHKIFVVGRKTRQAFKSAWTPVLSCNSTRGKNIEMYSPDVCGSESGSSESLARSHVLPFVNSAKWSKASRVLFLCGDQRRSTMFDICGESIEETVTYTSKASRFIYEGEMSDLSGARWYVVCAPSDALSGGSNATLVSAPSHLALTFFLLSYFHLDRVFRAVFFSPLGVKYVSSNDSFRTGLRDEHVHLAAIGPTTAQAVDSLLSSDTAARRCVVAPCPNPTSLLRAIQEKEAAMRSQRFRVFMTTASVATLVSSIAAFCFVVGRRGRSSR